MGSQTSRKGRHSAKPECLCMCAIFHTFKSAWENRELHSFISLFSISDHLLGAWLCAWELGKCKEQTQFLSY